jgi:hypothetical protein
MKLSQLSPSAKEFEFTNPYTNEPTGIKVTLYPMKSKEGKQAEHEMRLKILELMQDENNTIEIDGKKNMKEDVIIDVSLEMLASIVVDWNGIEDEKGEPLKFSKENAIKAFKEYREFSDFVYNTANNVGNFLKE